MQPLRSRRPVLWDGSIDPRGCPRQESTPFPPGSAVVQINTERFGTLDIGNDQIFLFPQGLIGMESLRQWALIGEPSNEAVAWFQSIARPDRAVPVISPRSFFGDYRVHVARRELTPLLLTAATEVYVLTTVAGHVGRLSTNLRAPMLINLDRRLGAQVITEDQRPLRQPLQLPAADVSGPVAQPTIRRVAA